MDDQSNSVARGPVSPMPSRSGYSGSRAHTWVLPVSIFISALIVGGAVVYNAGVGVGGEQAGAPNGNRPSRELAAVSASLRDVDMSRDHIRGNPKAPVKIIEWSDTECPFCKRFHSTMQELVDKSEGQVAWVYRHFPLASLHPKAHFEAEATECAAELGGNDAFWAYLDRLFAITPSNNGLNPDLLPDIAVYVGLNRQVFVDCLQSGKYITVVDADYDEAVTSGGRGTPFSVVIGSNGQKIPVSGALPLERMEEFVQQALQ